MTSSLVERCCEVFQPQIFVNHYGSTGDLHVLRSMRDQSEKPGCAGRAALNARLRLGEDGEIECHLGSDEAFAGYWRRPDADEKAIRDGWYRTGDVGRIDEDGDLWVDRPRRRHDRVRAARTSTRSRSRTCSPGTPVSCEVAVVGAPDDRLGQRVVAVVVGDGDGARSSMRTASPRSRLRASSGRASTASSPRSRRARLGRSSAGSYVRRV